VTTHEPELTEPVDLCTPDGTGLNPAARGWSRRPLHRANLDGAAFGRNKRWDYWAVLAGDVVISAVFSNVDYMGIADVWWADLVSGEQGGSGVGGRGGDGFALPEVPATAPLVVARDGFELSITDGADGATRLAATWTERDGRPGRLDVTVALPPDHESLNVVIPWSDETFNFTSKHQGRPARGELEVGDRQYDVDGWGVLDVGRGRWPSEITWNWGGGAGRTIDGVHAVGLQIGGKWTVGTGFTENGVIVDGRLSKIGRELDWDYDWDEPMKSWRVSDPGGQLNAVLTPRFDKHSRAVGRKRSTETHQVFGTWSGTVTTDDGIALRFDDLQGFAEEARQNWYRYPGSVADEVKRHNTDRYRRGNVDRRVAGDRRPLDVGAVHKLEHCQPRAFRIDDPVPRDRRPPHTRAALFRRCTWPCSATQRPHPLSSSNSASSSVGRATGAPRW
jgi:hypothetical protein